jgi:PsbP
MKSHLARILSYAVCWVLALTASALTAEKNPPGDIPDDQVFVSYKSSVSGYSLKVPEGWARSEKGSDVQFIDKFDGVAVIVDVAATPPTMKDVVTRLGKAEKGFKVVSTKEIRLPLGSVLLVKYESDSETNPVTNKRIRLEDEAYAFYKNGKIAILILWAPVGADNADQWKMISESFRW